MAADLEGKALILCQDKSTRDSIGKSLAGGGFEIHAVPKLTDLSDPRILPSINYVFCDKTSYLTSSFQGLPAEAQVILFSCAEKEGDKIKFYTLDFLEDCEGEEFACKIINKVDRRLNFDFGRKWKSKGFTAIQIEILEMVSHGECNKKIAAQVHLSIQGVKYHISTLLKAFSVSNRKELQMAINRVG